MTKFEQDVTRKLAGLEAGIEYIKDALERDYKHIHGNGSPGLIDRVKELEDWRVASQSRRAEYFYAAGFVINAAIAIYAIFKK